MRTVCESRDANTGDSVGRFTIDGSAREQKRFPRVGGGNTRITLA